MFLSISNEKHKTVLLNRLSKLTPLSQRLWGTMSVEEMLFHLRMQIEFALGNKKVEKFPQFYTLYPVKWLSIYIVPWPKGFKTAKAMNAKKQIEQIKDFLTEYDLLINSIQSVLTQDKLFPHPLFGKLSHKMWFMLIGRHIDYHLKQFGQ